MNIHILPFQEGARSAVGCAVVIDVFRALSTACYAASGGAGPIIPVADLETAYALKRARPDAILMGERDGAPPPGFDFGNSPTHIAQADVAGRTLIHTTSNGTQGLVAAMRASATVAVLTGSFVNAGAIVGYIRKGGFEEVSLVPVGRGGLPAEEDDLCAEFLRDRLLGKTPAFAPIRAELAASRRSVRFFDPARIHAPATDFDLCLDVDRFDFVLRATPDEGGFLRLAALGVGG